MKLYYMGIIKNDGPPTAELVSALNLADYSYFQRKALPSLLTMLAKGVAESVKPGQRHDAQQEQYVIHAYARSEGLCGIIVSDAEYPTLVTHQLLSKITDEFLVQNPRATFATLTQERPPAGKYIFKELEGYLTKYQNPEEADSIMKIQKELDETKIILHKTIEGVLARGEKLDDLVERSNDLGALSKTFYQGAKKQNSCCVVM